MRSKFPGVFNVLELTCRRATDRGCVDLLIDEPEKLRYLLEQLYGNPSTVELIAKTYIRSVLLEVDKPELTNEPTALLLNNRKEFSNKLKELLEKRP
ncbi:MAG: hypothetical protein QW705_07795 [Zestosphaera sp.]